MTATSFNDAPPGLLYRFRPLSRLLGSGELAKQEIYFASPQQLNDPMEGFLDIYWRGDLVAWQNLFKHYIRCLDVAFSLAMLLGEREAITWDQIPVVGPFAEESGLPREEYLTQAFREFMEDSSIREALTHLASRELPIRRDELRAYCSSVHMFAMSVLWTQFEAQGMQPAGSGTHLREAGRKSAEAARELAWQHARLLSQDEEPSRNRALFATRDHVAYQLGLVDALLAKEGSFPNRDFVFRDFPFEFPDQLERLIYPDWRVACFMAEARNASLWGSYGDSHRGVCLVFKPELESGRATLPLSRIVGRGPSGPIKGKVQQDLHRVHYTKRFPEVDFFRSIGRLPVGQLFKHWHSDGEGRRSSCALDYGDEWREAYWKAFYPGISTKLQDWEREREFRMILSGFGTDFSQPEQCKATYEFESLAGLVFGMKTPMAEKLAIIRIVGEKCSAAGRRDFKFYEARYSEAEGKIDHVNLDLLERAFDIASSDRIGGRR